MSENFSIYNIIQKKRDKGTLTAEEINWVINSLLIGEIEDYQMSSLLMAIFLNGMTVEETKALTNAMLYSGKVLDFKDQIYIDKHSTGGVGDKTSFILAPIAAACGVKVPMIAGRGLGHTGGTIDKIEAVKGFKTEIDLAQFEKLLKERGLVLIGQTKEIAPADKRIYALRDVTATVESIPLITASIMSKKLAEGAKGIVMDIKTGSGAFMAKLSDAKKLAKSISDTGIRFDKNMMTIISDMSEPLGCAIGNSIEIIESVETLRGNGPKDLTDLSVHLAGGMIYLAGLAKTHAEGNKKALESIKNGSALEKFRELIINQGGDAKFIDNYSLLPKTTFSVEVLAKKSGYIKEIKCKEFGLHCVELGGGRRKTSDKIDFAVGLYLHKKVNDFVKAGESVVTIYCHDSQVETATKMASSILNHDIVFTATKPRAKKKLIIETKTTFVKKSITKKPIAKKTINKKTKTTKKTKKK